MYQKNAIYLTSALLLFGCMDTQKQGNETDAGPSIEEKQQEAPQKGITFKKNADGKYEYVGRDLPFSLRKKDIGPSDPNSTSSEPNRNKSKLAEVFTVKWPWEKTNKDLNNEKPEEVEADVSALEAETDINSVDVETETTSEKSKSKLAEIFTVVWPWGKNKN